MTGFTNPFTGLEFTKYIPNVDMGVFVEAQRKNIEALTTANKHFVEGVQALTKKQVELAKEAFEGGNKAFADIAEEKTYEGKALKQAELLHKAFHSSQDSLKQLADIMAQSNDKTLKIINTRIDELVVELKGELAKKADPKTAAK